jgi:N-acetylglucosaminyldiphosphoundecaprenol N-acetyl-beta-D-mannosaminyltransferase
MFSILVKKIIITDGNSFNDLLEDKGKVYTFLNPVSYLTALENKELFASFSRFTQKFF